MHFGQALPILFPERISAHLVFSPLFLISSPGSPIAGAFFLCHLGYISAMQNELDFIPDTCDGRPCCYIDRNGGSKTLPPDLMGMGIPCGGLPPFLQSLSICGWRVEKVKGKLDIFPAHRGARWEEGCRKYLEANRDKIARSLSAWKRQCARYGGLK